MYCCKYGFQSDTIVVSHWLYSADLIGWQCHVRQGHAQLSLWLVLHRKHIKTEEHLFPPLERLYDTICVRYHLIWCVNPAHILIVVDYHVWFHYYLICILIPLAHGRKIRSIYSWKHVNWFPIEKLYALIMNWTVVNDC